MAYYDALVSAWNSTAQPPSTAITGVGLTSTMATTDKLTDLNAWTVTGSVPTSLQVSATQLANCVVYSEFKALTAQQQNNLMGLLHIPGNLSGGSTNVALLPDGMFLDYFSSTTTTFANLVALAKAASQPWWQYAGYNGPFNMNDINAAGLT
jgi:hypothetical protein